MKVMKIGVINTQPAKQSFGANLEITCSARKVFRHSVDVLGASGFHQYTGNRYAESRIIGRLISAYRDFTANSEGVVKIDVPKNERFRGLGFLEVTDENTGKSGFIAPTMLLPDTKFDGWFTPFTSAIRYITGASV